MTIFYDPFFLEEIIENTWGWRKILFEWRRTAFLPWSLAFLNAHLAKGSSFCRAFNELCSRSRLYTLGLLLFFNPIMVRPPLGVISHHSVGDAPTNSKFLDFSQFDPYFHLVKSFFTFFFVISTKKLPSNLFRPK